MMPEPVQLTQIRQWESGEIRHDVFSFGHGFGTALVEAFDALDGENFRLRNALIAARDFIKYHPAVSSGNWPLLYDLIDRALVGDTERGEIEIDVRGHKVFVYERDGSKRIEMVNDDRPLVRMTLELLPEEARDVADQLNGDNRCTSRTRGSNHADIRIRAGKQQLHHLPANEMRVGDYLFCANGYWPVKRIGWRRGCLIVLCGGMEFSLALPDDTEVQVWREA